MKEQAYLKKPEHNLPDFKRKRILNDQRGAELPRVDTDIDVAGGIREWWVHHCDSAAECVKRYQAGCARVERAEVAAQGP